MSTRYVWGVYNTGVQKRSQIKITVDLGFSKGYSFDAKFCNEYTSEIATTPNGGKVALYTAIGGINAIAYGITQNGIRYHTVGTNEFKYIVITIGRNLGGSSKVIAESYLVELSPPPYGAIWHTNSEVTMYGSSITSYKNLIVWNSDSAMVTVDFDGDTSQKYNFYVTGGELSQSSLLYTETSASNSKTEGPFLSGGNWRWRKYRGADTIDPTAISYSSGDLYSDELVTITVTPRTPTYGGTIYYQYQYSINGGATWTNIGSKTTDASKSITIPEGADQFQARVLASDGWGFTSKTYVYGSNLPVSQIKAYATVGGKNRAGAKIYATVNGKIRQVQKGYVTVVGKIRKLF